jgi:hypothetical protein
MYKCYGSSEKAISRWEERGDGHGEGSDYRPFFRVQDVPSLGRSRKFLGIKSGRIHHVLSDVEYYSALDLEHDPNVLDFKEQYRLPRDQTVQIAKQLNIKHPVYPRNQLPIVMTTDFVVTFKNRENETEAVAIKPFSAISPDNPNSERTLDKLLIEKIFWTRRGIPWRVQTENDFSITKAINLDMLRASLLNKELDEIQAHLFDFVRLFIANWKDYLSLNEILFRVGDQLQLNLAQCFGLFGRAIWRHMLPVDLEVERIGHAFPIVLESKGDDSHDQR